MEPKVRAQPRSPSSALVSLFWPACGAIFFAIAVWAFVTGVQRLLQPTYGSPDADEYIMVAVNGILLGVLVLWGFLLFRKSAAQPPGWVLPVLIVLQTAIVALPALGSGGLMAVVRAIAPTLIVMGTVFVLGPVLRPVLALILGPPMVRQPGTPQRKRAHPWE